VLWLFVLYAGQGALERPAGKEQIVAMETSREVFFEEADDLLPFSFAGHIAAGLVFG
jgi:hypothetical protein